MIIFGTGSKHLETRSIDSAQCPSCQNSTITIRVFQKYFDNIWIPVFPFSMIAVVDCSYCNLVLEEKHIPDSLQKTTKEIKKKNSTPFYLFAGLFLILPGIAFGIYSEQKEDEMTRAFLSEPQVNDYYVIETYNPENPIYKYVI